jgi:hypothetical protein
MRTRWRMGLSGQDERAAEDGTQEKPIAGVERLLPFGEWDLDGELVFDRSFGMGDDLDMLQALLRDLAPAWSSRLRLWRGSKDQRPINVSQNGALKAAVMAAASERGSTYRGLVERHGHPPYERLAGSAELRGTGPELVVVVSVDAMVVSPLGLKKQLGNHVTLQVRRRTIERREANEWMREAFETLCDELSPAWGWAGHAAEYWAKVMSDAPRVEAIGRDFGRFLPGVFWLNFFGRRCSELVGEERLRATPAEHVATIDDGVLVQLATSPLAWNTPEYASEEQKVRDHLGPELFFSKTEPDRVTVVPDWDS